MTTRTKLYISSYTASALMLLNVFSKPLHIPEALQWVLLVGVFILLGLVFHFNKQQKLERQTQPASTKESVRPMSETRQSAKRQLILVMVIGSASSLCSPVWLPLTGTTMGVLGDLVCGIIAAVVVCAVCGFRLRRLLGPVG
jgi:hypothetical protein